MGKKTKKGNGLNYKQTFLIGFGFMACMLMWSIYNSYVPVIFRAKLTELTDGGSKLPAFLSVALFVNAIMTIDNIFGVIFQPYFGKKSDKTNSKKWGKRMPYIIICLPICAVFFSLIPVAATVKAAALSIILMMTVIIFFNFTMSIWRSPVVSLMPDFTPSALQSDANAVINIMGGIGQMIGFVIGTIATTLVGLLGFTQLHNALKAQSNTLGQILATNADGSVKINYLGQFANGVPAQYQESVDNFIQSGRDALYFNGTHFSSQGTESELVAQKVIKLVDGNPVYVNYTPIFVVGAIIAVLCLVILAIFYKKNKQNDLSAAAAAGKADDEISQKKIKIKDLPITAGERKSLIVMLISLFLINNATEAIVPNFTNFALDTLNVKPIYSTLMMAIFAVSLAAFGIPAGAMGRKLGRKKTIIIGLSVIVVMFAIYLTVSQVFAANKTFVWIVLWIALVVGGAAVGCININTLPLVLAIGGRDYVGTFTGYYYTATFSAAITGPILCGLVIGLFDDNYNYMFLFCAIMFAVGLVAITQVKHGESTKEDEEWIQEAVEAADD